MLLNEVDYEHNALSQGFWKGLEGNVKVPAKEEKRLSRGGAGGGGRWCPCVKRSGQATGSQPVSTAVSSAVALVFESTDLFQCNRNTRA